MQNTDIAPFSKLQYTQFTKTNHKQQAKGIQLTWRNEFQKYDVTPLSNQKGCSTKLKLQIKVFAWGHGGGGAWLRESVYLRILTAVVGVVYYFYLLLVLVLSYTIKTIFFLIIIKKGAFMMFLS